MSRAPNQALQQTGAAFWFLGSVWSSERPLLLSYFVHPSKTVYFLELPLNSMSMN